MTQKNETPVLIVALLITVGASRRRIMVVYAKVWNQLESSN